MARTINVHDAKTHFSRLLDDAHAGEEIILAKAGKPYGPAGAAGTGGCGAQAWPPGRPGRRVFLRGPSAGRTHALGVRRAGCCSTHTHCSGGRRTIHGCLRPHVPPCSIRPTRCSSARPAPGRSPPKVRLGKMPGLEAAATRFEELCAADGFQPLPMTSAPRAACGRLRRRAPRPVRSHARGSGRTRRPRAAVLRPRLRRLRHDDALVVRLGLRR